MKTMIGLFVLLLLCGTVSADSCGPTLSDGAFLASWCSRDLFIAGPKGIDDLHLQFVPDWQRSFFLNSSGQVAGSLEFDGDRASYIFSYAGAGEINTWQMVSQDNLFVFDWPPPGPVFFDAREPGGREEPIDVGLFPSLLITGFSDQGVMSGIYSYVYDFHPMVEVPFTTSSVPEPAGLLILAGGLLFLKLVVRRLAWKQ
jgi:hypothetical protein